MWRLHYELKARTFRISGYYKFTIYDPKEREIQALSFRDRVVQHVLCDNILQPYFDRRLIYDCAACRLNKGTHFAMRRLTQFMTDYYRKHGTEGYFLKCDIRKFFDSIDHEVLKEKLASFPERDIRALLMHIVDSYNADTGKGLPMGNQSSQWFALYYLDSIDRLIKEKLHIKYYTRYMDDLILIHPSKEYLRYCRREIEAEATRLRIELNEKTQIFPISEGVDYLGWHYYMTDTGKVIRKLRTSNKKRFKRRLKNFKKLYRKGEIEEEDIQRSLRSYMGHLKHGHTYKLRKEVFRTFLLK